MLVRHLAAQDRAARLLVHRAGPRPGGPCPPRGRRPGSRGACASPRRRSATSRPSPDAAEEAGDGLERSLRGGQADALERSGRLAAVAAVASGRAVRAQALEALEAEREVGAALGPGDRVDLVHDDLLDAAQDLARLAGQQQVEALGRGDQDVRRVADEVAALVGRGVAGAARDRDPRRLLPQALGGQRDARQRGAQVALHVVGEGLERADVQDADAARVPARRRRPRVLDQAVQAPQERGEGLAAAGGGMDQGAAAGADRRPALRPGPAWGPRTSPRTRPGRRARTVRADPCCARPRDAEYRPQRHFRTDVLDAAGSRQANGGLLRARRSWYLADRAVGGGGFHAVDVGALHGLSAMVAGPVPVP